MTTSTPRISHPATCAGPCNDGRRLCPCPTACGISADPPTGIRAPLPNSVGRWARVAFGGVVLLLACIGAGALTAFLSRALLS